MVHKKGLCVGAGAYSGIAELCFSEKIGGEAIPIRGEMGAITLMLQLADKQRGLTIMKDSLSTIQKIQ